MTSKTHWVGQALAMILQALNLYGGMVPGKYQPWVAFSIAVVQAAMGLYNHNFTPQGTKIAALLLMVLLLPVIAGAQTPVTPAQLPPLPDIPITHVSVSASFTGYDSNGKMVAANIDTFGVAIYRNAAATQGFNVSYEHIAIPDLGQRWELGLGSYWFNLPKVKGVLFDTSNFVATVSAGAGKLLSASDGNRFAYTVSPSITYPIAGHMAWTVSYQYLRATGGPGPGIAGAVNKSFQSVGTGPLLYF